MGMITQLGKFSAGTAELSKPMRELLSSKHAWNWGPAQGEAFVKLKAELTVHTVLALHDPQADTKILLMPPPMVLPKQCQRQRVKKLCVCEKFSTYVLGKHISIETDHKPLLPILGSKHLRT